MTISVVVLPTRPTRGHGSPAARRLRTAMGAVVAGLPPAPTVVVVASGREPLVEEVTALAVPGATVQVLGAPELVSAIVERGQIPRVQAAALGGPSAALAARVHEARDLARFVGVTVSGRGDPAAIQGATAALRGALVAGSEVVLLVSGDIEMPGDTEADRALLERVRDALRDHDVTTLAATASDHAALSPTLAPLRLALGIAQARGERFEVLADEVIDGRLHVVGVVR